MTEDGQEHATHGHVRKGTAVRGPRRPPGTDSPAGRKVGTSQMDRTDVDQGYGYASATTHAGGEVTAASTAATSAGSHAAGGTTSTPTSSTRPPVDAESASDSSPAWSGTSIKRPDDQGYAGYEADEDDDEAAAADRTDRASRADEKTPPPRRAKPSCAVTVTAIAQKARPLRRDAERNRLLILSAAKTVFAQRGLEASLDEIAKEAGLGVGTVYRRFPNRDALIDALSADVLSSIERIIDEAITMPRAWDGLYHFMAAMLESQSADKGLRDAMVSRHGYQSAEEDIVRAKLEPAMFDLVSRAQQQGDLRPDVTATDIGVLLVAALGIAEFTASQSNDVWRRHLAILLDGLRARPTGTNSVLDQPALNPDQIDECMTGWKYGSRETPRQRQKPS
jgi:AcrR family transcriptional regulator